MYFLTRNLWFKRPYFLLKFLLDLNYKVKLSEYDEIWAVRHFDAQSRNPTYLEQYSEHKDTMIKFIEKNYNYDMILQRVFRLGRSKLFLDKVFDEEIMQLSIKINIYNE